MTAVRARLARAVGAWNRFWFEPEETSTLAVVRILFGLVVLGWALSLAADLGTFFTTGGLLSRQPTFNAAGLWAPLSVSSSTALVVGAYVALLLAAICIIFGLASRFACFVVWLGVLAFTRRNPYVFNAGDAYLRVVAFYVMLTPSGAALSVRRWLRDRQSFWEFPKRSLWGLRLLQIQVSIAYLSAFWDKLRSGPLWNDGTALSFVLRIKDVDRLPTPTFPTSGVIDNALTYGTLAIELAVGVLVWNRRLRPWVLGLGVALHLAIEYSIRVGFFSLVAIVALIAFVSPQASARAIFFLRDLPRAVRTRRLPDLVASSRSLR